MLARDEGSLSRDDYCEAVNMLTLSGHAYISLGSDCLMHQARKDEFALSKDLSRLLASVGGPLATSPRTVKS
jgi:hypothetical protein